MNGLSYIHLHKDQNQSMFSFPNNVLPDLTCLSQKILANQTICSLFRLFTSVRQYKEVHVLYLTDSASGGASSETECPICLDTLKNARTLKCKHVFCTDCVETALKHNNRCPVCKEVQGVIQGNQPKGEMRFQKIYDRLPGYYGNSNSRSM